MKEMYKCEDEYLGAEVVERIGDYQYNTCPLQYVNDDLMELIQKSEFIKLYGTNESYENTGCNEIATLLLYEGLHNKYVNQKIEKQNKIKGGKRG